MEGESPSYSYTARPVSELLHSLVDNAEKVYTLLVAVCFFAIAVPTNTHDPFGLCAFCFKQSDLTIIFSPSKVRRACHAPFAPSCTCNTNPPCPDARRKITWQHGVVGGHWAAEWRRRSRVYGAWCGSTEHHRVDVTTGRTGPKPGLCLTCHPAAHCRVV